ncbi:ribosomal protein S6 kinase delta-1-like isoform X1 [Homarus americanus]|uniref:ribosomal protein S6 kinase delta-1-like isoform X1 n=1 Tax=Homarus americanus TaxID=6706 RepID=UPI001C44CBBB|nr:ribosomal protein S6 kinase delta-1-like isoform X1 [Homarus americanus]
MAAQTDHWLRVFQVEETRRHTKGYTIYKVKSSVCPRNSPEASTSVVVWRRYSEVRRLHKAISELHQRLGLPGQLPPFPRATVLNRFEADVVETRRQATLDLLKFIGQHSPLFTSDPFTKFFQNEDNGSKHSSLNKIRKNSRGRSKEADSLASTLGIQESSSLYSQLSDTEDDFSVCSSLDSPPAVDALCATPTYPTASVAPSAVASASTAVAITDGSCEGKDTLTTACQNHTGVSGLSVSQRTNSKRYNSQENFWKVVPNRTITDTERREEVKCDLGWGLPCGKGVENNVFFFHTGNCDVKKDNKDTVHPSERHESTSSSQPCCVYENPVHNSPKQHQKPYPSEEPRHIPDGDGRSLGPVRVKQTPRPIPPLEISRRISISGRKNSVPLTPLTPLTTTVTPVISTHKIPSPQEVANTQYVFIAAQQINEAQQHEQNRDYKQALNMYREGVGTLLQGVQASNPEDHAKKRGDGDGSRREAVRRKTAQYLQRAEQLVARLTRKDKKKDQLTDGPPPEINSSGEGGLKCRASDLSRYRVAGLAGSVIIATDTTNGDTVAIKVVIKSGSGSGEKTVVPENIPFMVPIIRYHETDNAIYLVLKFISGGKLWSHIKKYVVEENTNPNEIYNTSSNTYAGRRLLQETTEYDGLASEALSLCETPSLASHLSSHQSCSHTTPSTNNLLTVPGCSSLGGCSGCSEASSSCLPDGYLQIFSEYTHGLPSSSSMLVIPPLGQSTNVTTDTVPKSMSAGALVVAAGCSDICQDAQNDAKLSVTEDKLFPQDGIFLNGSNLMNDADKVSIGSDTLSGVSEDFSCSIPVSVPNLLPDPLPLPEVRVTDDPQPESNVDLMNNEEESHCTKCKDDAVDGVVPPGGEREAGAHKHCEQDHELVKPTYNGKENEMNYNKQDNTLHARYGGRDPLFLRTTDTHLGLEEDREDNSVTDTSFASVTLPSFSWTKREDSELASLDIDDLIRNSKQLLQNVDYTLQQSKSQGVTACHDSDESTSVDHSELPYDSDSIGFDQTDKGKNNTPKTENEKKIHQNKQSFAVSAIGEGQPSGSRLRVRNNSQKPRGSTLKAVKSESSLLVRPDSEADHEERSIATECVSSQKVKSQRVTIGQGVEPSPANQNVRVQPEQPQSVKANNLNSRENCDVPIESSLAALLEKYSANRGHDSRPRLPEGIVKVWSSQVISAITALHQLGIVWGDFNFDNVLLDEGGSILVTYKSRWSSVQRNVRSSTSWKNVNELPTEGEAGAKQKMGYLAPELKSPLAFSTTASDWWSIGALMYHMLTGQSVWAAHPSGITSHTELLMPSHLTAEAASLLSQLLCAHPTERLGGGVAGAQEVKDHAFFTGIQWTE